MIYAAIASLQGKAPLQGLDVVDHRFGIERELPSLAADYRVPGPEVPLDRQRHLGPPSQARMESGPESFEQPDLPGVADCIAGRVGAKSDLQTHDGAKGSDILRREVAEHAPFEAPDSRVVDPRGCSDRAKAQPGPNSRSSEIAGDDLKVRPNTSPPSVAWAFAGAHRVRWWPSMIHCHLSRQPILLLWAPQATTERIRARVKLVIRRYLLLAAPQTKARSLRIVPGAPASPRLWGSAQHRWRTGAAAQ